MWPQETPSTMPRVRALFEGGPPAGKTPTHLATIVRSVLGVGITPVADAPWQFDAAEGDAPRLVRAAVLLAGVNVRFELLNQPTHVDVTIVTDGDQLEAVDIARLPQAVAAAHGIIITPVPNRALVFRCESAADAQLLFASATHVGNVRCRFIFAANEDAGPPVVAGLVRARILAWNGPEVSRAGASSTSKAATAASLATKLADLPPPSYQEAIQPDASRVQGARASQPPTNFIEAKLASSRTEAAASEAAASAARLGSPVRPTARQQDAAGANPPSPGKSGNSAGVRGAPGKGKQGVDSSNNDKDDADADADDDDDDDSDDDDDLPASIHIFHDSENCYVPNDPRIDGALLYDNVVQEILRLYLPAERASGIAHRDIGALLVQWRFVVRRMVSSNPYCIHTTTFDQLQDRGVEGVLARNKDGSVDVKLKELMQQFLEDNRMVSKSARRRMVVAILAGDRDYTPEIKQLRRAGFVCVILHRGEATNGVRRQVQIGQRPMDSGRWDDLVAAASTAKQHREAPPAARAAAPERWAAPGGDPGGDPGAPSGTTVGGPHGNIIYERTVPFRLALFLSDPIGRNVLLHIIPDKFNADVVKGNPAKVQLTAAEGTAPTPSERRAASAALDKFIDEGIVAEPAIAVAGVAPEEIRKNYALLQEARRHNVFVFVPMAAGQSGSAGGQAPPVGLQLVTPRVWTEQDVVQFCDRQHGLGVHKVMLQQQQQQQQQQQPPAYAAASAPNRWAVILDNSRHGSAGPQRAALYEDLCRRRPIPVLGVPVKFVTVQLPPKAGAAAPQGSGNGANAPAQPSTTQVTLITTETDDVGERLRRIREAVIKLARGQTAVPLKESWKYHLLRDRRIHVQPVIGRELQQLAARHGVSVAFKTDSGDASSAPGHERGGTGGFASPSRGGAHGAGGHPGGAAPHRGAGGDRAGNRGGRGGRGAHRSPQRGGHSAAGQQPGRGGYVAGAPVPPRQPLPTARAVVISGPLVNVKEAADELRDLLRRAIITKLDIPAEKQSATLLTHLRQARKELSRAERNNDTTARSPTAAGSSDDSEAETDDDNDDDDGDNGNGDAGSGARGAVLNVSIPSKWPGEVYVAAFGADAVAATEAVAMLQALVDRFKVERVTIPPNSHIDVTPRAWASLEAAFNVRVWYWAEGRPPTLEISGDAANVDDAKADVQRKLEGSADTTKVVTGPHALLALLLGRRPQLADTVIAQARARFPGVHIHDTNGSKPLMPGKSRSWRLNGPRALVESAAAFLTQQLNALADTMAVKLVPLLADQLSYVRANQRTLFASAGENLPVYIRLAGAGGAATKAGPSSHASAQPIAKPTDAPSELGRGTVGDIAVKVILADFRRVSADAIVNPANTDLANTGGLAGALAAAAGPQLAAACQMLRPVHPGNAKVSDSYGLRTASPGPFRYIVHTVAPIHRTGAPAERDLLVAAAAAAFQEANAVGATSLAIPAIGSQLFGWDVGASASAIATALRNFATATSSLSHALREVVLFDNRPEAASALAQALQAEAAAAAAAPTTAGQRSIGSRARATPPAAPMPVPALRLPTHQWEWANDLGGFTPYDYDQNEQLELAFGRFTRGEPNAESKVRITGDINGVFSDSRHIPAGYRHPVYDVDLTSWQQINVASGFRRTVRRRQLRPGELPPHTPADVRNAMTRHSPALSVEGAAGEPAAMGNYKSGTAAAALTFSLVSTAAASVPPPNGAAAASASAAAIEIFGERSAALQAERLLQALLAGAVVTKACDVDPLITMPLPELIAHVSPQVARHGGTLQAAPHGRQIVVSAYGNSALDMAVLTLTAALQEQVISATRVQYPGEWDLSPAGRSAYLHAVAPSSAEYKTIQSIFLSDGFSATILKMERVQNQRLWECYFDKRRRVQLENGGDANERYMKHGTRNLAPETIFGGQDCFGFDMRYSADGFYGRAAYFAERTVYSHGYRYDVPGQPNVAQMFIALVACGRVDDRTARGVAIDRTIKHPPPGHHCIRAMVATNDPAVMVYELYQAYPAYLITYQFG